MQKHISLIIGFAFLPFALLVFLAIGAWDVFDEYVLGTPYDKTKHYRSN